MIFDLTTQFRSQTELKRKENPKVLEHNATADSIPRFGKGHRHYCHHHSRCYSLYCRHSTH